jgi:nucleotidyltransferase substrate binding protein (TIGR01987 family)
MTPTADIRWQQRLSNFERALALLSAALIDGPAALNQLEKQGVIQRFEYGFELAWKTTKDYMEANGFLFAVVMPRQVLKDAYAAKVIADGAVWIAMLDHRNLLSPSYTQRCLRKPLRRFTGSTCRRWSNCSASCSRR